ncbi:MAG: GTPase HflX [Pseudomonadales bacterium]|nr:MAG: GTPase HflX [Pseudomonadales bacterium]
MFFERPEAGERALLVHCHFTRPQRDALDSSVDEFIELVRAAGVSPVYLESTRRDDATPRYLIGAGKVEEMAELVAAHDIDVVLFNHSLSPSQERNLEKVLQCKVVDRTGLILDIFAQRARSHAGKLQVELAQLEHISTRLIRGWTHLERQRGGIGLRGPGESQLETDRRLLRERIKTIRRRLQKIDAQHQQGRRARNRAELPTVALVGYTNAGKSTLFNALTASTVLVKDQLFATLDTTMRALELAGFGRLVLADTVGFVSNLPHQLVDAFKATLDEAAEADLLLHIVDASAADLREQFVAVERVLEEIGAEDLPCICVMNKSDLLAPAAAGPGEALAAGDHPAANTGSLSDRVTVSARTGAGLDRLREALIAALDEDRWNGELQLAPGDARLRARLFAMGAVQSEHIAEDGSVTLNLAHRRKLLQRILQAEGKSLPTA